MADIVWTSPYTGSSEAVTNVEVLWITDSVFVVCWINSTYSTAYASVYDDEGNHLHSQSLFSDTFDQYYTIQLARVRDNVFALAYTEDAGFKTTRCRMLTWNGSIITDNGQIAVLNLQETRCVGLCNLGDDKLMLWGRRFSISDVLYCSYGTYNGSSWSFGSFSTIIGSDYADEIRACTVKSDKGILIWDKDPDADTKCHGFSTSAGGGTDIVAIDGTDELRHIRCCRLMDNRVIVTGHCPNEPDGGRVYAITLEDELEPYKPTVGLDLVFNPVNVSWNSYCSRIDNTHFLIAFEDATDSGKGKSCLCTVNWDTLTIIKNDTEIFSNNDIGGGGKFGLGMDSNSEGKLGLAYRDESDSNYLKVMVGIQITVPDPPTGISTEGGEEQNTITFTVNPEADDTHIYWSNSPGVSPETGTKIASVSSPYVHDELNPSLTYYYVLTSENTEGEGDPSAEYNDSPIPEPPENVAVTPGIEKNIITWDAAFGADSYNIYWSFSPSVNKITGTKIIGVTSPHEHSSLTPGVPVYYVVVSEDEDGESSVSAEDSGIPELDEPSSPYAELTGALEITVTWNVVLGATRYNLYWSKSPGVTKETGTKISDVSTPYVHSDLDEYDTYYYVVTAENVSDESDESSEVSAVAGDVPEAPINVVATGTDIQEITVSWSSVPDVESYNLYYGVITGLDKITAVKIEDVTSPYVFDALIPDITYYFFVTAVDDITGESDESAEVNALSIPPIPDIPLDVEATPGEAKIIIDFTVAPYADTHHIYWGINPGVTKETGTKISDVSPLHEFTVPALYVLYYFVVTAENESGEGDESSEVSETPIPVIPDAPINLAGVPTDSGEITLSWDAATYAETYNIYYARLPDVSKSTASKIEGVVDVEKAIDSLIGGRFYYFCVTSVNPGGESDLSNEINVRAVNSLVGQQPFYIKAESDQNSIVVTWSDLKDADSYNVYWSKTTPVNTSTANKIESVTSPYRHYRLTTDDPYYVVTGENALGESDPSDETSANPTGIEFQSINFLPENLHEYPLFQEFCNIIDYVVEKYHYENIDKLTGLYDAVHSDFDPNYILSLLGSDYFLQFDLTNDQKKALCLLLSNLYDMKGTKKGLDYVLRLMGLEAQVYEWYNINAGLYPEIPETVDPCSIVIDLGLGDYSLLEDEEQKFINLANYLLWVCVKLHGIFWSKKFEDWFENIEDEIPTVEVEHFIFDKFCAWRYNYPEVVIIGPPYGGSETLIGSSGLVIGATYYEGYPFLITADLEEGVDYNGVCDAHYIGEPGIYIGGGVSGGDISDLTYVIEED